jgi:hypothetical protein
MSKDLPGIPSLVTWKDKQLKPNCLSVHYLTSHNEVTTMYAQYLINESFKLSNLQWQGQNNLYNVWNNYV